MARTGSTAVLPLSEELPPVDIEHMPPGRLTADAQRAVGAVDDARPDRRGEVIRFVDKPKPKRLSLMEYLYYAGDDRFGALGVPLNTLRDKRVPPGSRTSRFCIGLFAEVADVTGNQHASKLVPARRHSQPALEQLKVRAVVVDDVKFRTTEPKEPVCQGVSDFAG